MRAAWRLAINGLSGRGRRTALLVGAVALSTALIVAVACAMASISAALTRHIEGTVGVADLRVLQSGTGKDVPASLLARVRAWPEIEAASGRLTAPLAVTFAPGGVVGAPTSATALGHGLGDSPRTPAPDLIAGRLPANDSEVVVDALLAELLSPAESGVRKADGWRLGTPRRKAEWYAADAPAGRLRLGDRVGVVRQLFPMGAMPFTIPVLQTAGTLTVVGVAAQPPLGGRAQAYLTMGGLEALSGRGGVYTQIDATVRAGVDPETVAETRRAELAQLDAGLLIQTTARVTSGAEGNMQSSQLGFILATFMAFLSASFIVLTGMTTSVTERQRELGVLRSIGAERTQLARAQVLAGALVGSMGALAGLPLGLLIAWALARAFRDQLVTGLVVPPGALALAVGGAVLSGVAGAAWPAWRAGRVSPLAALAVRAEPARVRGVAWVTAIGLAGLAVQLVIVGVPTSGQVIFWGYATAGLPIMFAGYFLLGVPAILVLTRVLAGPLSRLLALPPGLLTGTVRATPYRHGLTAGALMGGLALMVAIWTNGGAVLRDWLGRINFPDAFVSGPALPPWAQERLNSMTDLVERTCAITLHQVETDAFGVHGLQRYKSTFIAFEPGPFFDMMRPQWVEGDPASAIPRLEAGGAIIVAKEFKIAQGLGVGDRFTCRSGGAEHTFDIVGVVTSPGLEVVSKFFNIGEDYTDQSLHAVFGTRDDLRRVFHSDATQLIQIDLRDGVDDDEAVAAIRRELLGAGILDAGSGKHVKTMIRSFAVGALGVMAAVAMVAMLVACFGVAGLIVAGIEARRFEFGVLRAVGASRGLLTRLVLGEVLLVALTASVMGVLMGIQGAWAGQRLDRLLMGVDVRLRPPPGLIAASCGLLIVLCVLSALPAIVRLSRLRPRDLLGAVRG